MNVSELAHAFYPSPGKRIILEQMDQQGQIRSLEAIKDYNGTAVIVNGELFDSQDNLAYSWEGMP